MKFFSPYKVKYRISQGFAKNFNTSYTGDGLLGHPALDMEAPFKSDIIAVADSYCYSWINKDNQDLTAYRAVYTLTDVSGAWYEVSYGHLLDIVVKKGDLKKGDPIGTQGNTGRVFVGGVAPTYEQRKKGMGTHLHFQVRLVKPVDKKTSKGKYLMDVNGYVKYKDKFWEVVNPKNGFAGCVDPAPFFAVLTDTLHYGDKGDQVKILQQILKIPDDGIFGLGTEGAVKAFQKKHGLVADGIVGQSTRAKLLTL